MNLTENVNKKHRSVTRVKRVTTVKREYVKQLDERETAPKLFVLTLF